MKNNFIQTIDLNYSDKTLLAYIQAKDQEYLSQANNLAKEHAFKDKPSCEESLNDYREPVYRNYNLLASEVHNKLQAGIHLKYGRLDINETKSENQKLEIEQDTLKSKLNSLPKKDNPFPMSILFKVIGILLITFLLWVGEVQFISKSFGLIGEGWFSSKLMAIGISLGLLIIAHLAKGWIAKIKHKLLRISTQIGLIILLTGVFYALAVLRQEYFKQSAEIHLPLWVMIALNVLLFLSLYLMANYWLIPALEELKKDLDNLKTLKEKKKLQSAIKTIEDSISKNIQNLNEKNRLRLSIISFAKATQELVVKKYELAMSKYLQVNLATREKEWLGNNEVPPPLDTHYQDINI